MSMKRCFELSVSPSVSVIGRIVLIGSVLSFAAACGRRDAAKADSTIADTATTSTTTAVVTPSTPVESVSTGETTVSAESKANPAVAATNVTTGAAHATVTPAAPAHTTVHHTTVHHTDSTKVTPAAAATPAQMVSDTGQKTAADTSKKMAAAGGAVDHLLVSPQEYEGWKMFSVYCYRCHGVDAMGGGIAPNLRHSVSSEGSVTHEVFITTVTNGRLEKGMPTWKALLSPEQMEDLWLYVNARSSNRLYPGRPHMNKGANP
ncbi:MAG: cytochrome c [Gemmatimonadota bacterium]|nr:cytochrome c [Gemmatimonadota bacterium]